MVESTKYIEPSFALFESSPFQTLPFRIENHIFLKIKSETFLSRIIL